MDDLPEGGDRKPDPSRNQEGVLRKYIPYPYQSLDAEGKMIAVNDAWLDLLGRERESVIGTWFGELLTEKSRKRFREAFSTLKRTGNVSGIEFEILRADESTVLVSFDGQVEFDEEGEFVRCHCQFKDITERKQYKTFVQNSPDVILLHDETGEAKYVSSSVEREMGYDPDSLSGKDPFNDVHPDDRDRVMEAFSRLLSKPDKVMTAEYRIQNADGSYVWVESRGRNLRDEEGINGILLNSRVIDERKEYENALERYETLVEVAGDPMYMLDEEGYFTYVNEALVEITGYSEEELVGKHGLTVVAEEHIEEGEELIQSLLSAGEQHGTFELDIQTKSGESIPVENHISLLYSDGAFQGSLGVLRDITDRLERERKLQRERDRLDRFAGVVSHDLRNPLNVATGRLELAIEECESEHLEPVAQAHDRMETLIDDVLRLARAGESVGETDAIALADLIDGCWRNVDTDSATLLTETDAVIRADESRLQQLFENLFRNAVEHGGDNVTVTVGDLDDGFYVADDGPGIPESEREAVFEPGHSDGETGTGFGLSIVEEIVQAHDWEIRVVEGSEGGARFEITDVEFAAI